MNRNQVTAIMCSAVIVFVCASGAFADSTMNIQVLKISPQDERAVIKTADGKTKVVKPGDVLTEQFSSQQKQTNNTKTLTVIEIAEGRVVLEERQGNDKETVIIRLKDGKQTVEKVRRTAPGSNPLLKAAISSQPSATSKGKSKSGQKSSIN